jgi:hypothetical protein
MISSLKLSSNARHHFGASERRGGHRPVFTFSMRVVPPENGPIVGIKMFDSLAGRGLIDPSKPVTRSLPKRRHSTTAQTEDRTMSRPTNVMNPLALTTPLIS